MKIEPGTPLHVALAFSPQERVNVGRIALDGGVAILEYTPEFIASGTTLNPLGAAPSRALVRAKSPSTFGGLHGVFADSLPDAWGELLVRRRAIENGIDYRTLTSLDKLASVGNRGMGALVYEPAIPAEGIGTIDLDALQDQAIAQISGTAQRVLPELLRLGGPSGGARPKVLVAMNESGDVIAGDGPLPAGFDAYIVKFRSSRHDYHDIGALEAAYADMARAAGLEVAPTRLAGKGASRYFATKRFDRLPDDARSHVASVAGLLDVEWDSPAIDYDNLLRVVRAMTRDQQAVEAAFRRMAFNVIAHNRDDHAKQHAFLMNAGGRWRLAPSFDLTFSSGPNDNHYLPVNARTGSDITLDDIRTIGDRHSIDARRIDGILDQVLDAVGSHAEFFDRYSLEGNTKKEISNALDAGLLRLTKG